jgi:hypothetical protein
MLYRYQVIGPAYIPCWLIRMEILNNVHCYLWYYLCFISKQVYV